MLPIYEALYFNDGTLYGGKYDVMQYALRLTTEQYLLLRVIFTQKI